MAPQASMDISSPSAESQNPFLLSNSDAVPAPEAGDADPALHVTIRGPLPKSSSGSSSEAMQIKVSVQPLQLLYQPACFARLAAILTGPTCKSRTAELMDVFCSLESPEVQALSVAELACSKQPVPAVSLEVGDLAPFQDNTVIRHDLLWQIDDVLMKPSTRQSGRILGSCLLLPWRDS